MMKQAFIFDMDDTLALTSPIWREAEEHLLRHLGEHWTAELAANYKGMNALDVAATIHEQLNVSLSRSECQQILRTSLIDNFRQATIRGIDGATDLVRRCASTGIPMVVASGSPAEAIELTLESLGVREHFALTLSSERVALGKPHPDVFLAAAEQLGVSPDACLVFEDSLVGVQAARAAGMRCIVRPSSTDPEIPALATHAVADWAEVDVQRWLSRG
jgi:HAD superfamily hydrolase (TIGR01509 family)